MNTGNSIDNIKNILRYYMARYGVSMDELAQAVHVDRSTLYNMFKTPNKWRIENLLGCYEFLKVPSEERFHF